MRQRANLRTTLIRDVRMIVDNLKSRAVKDRRPLWFGKAILIFKFGIEYRLIIRITRECRVLGYFLTARDVRS
jgi:hypothetical protein